LRNKLPRLKEVSREVAKQNVHEDRGQSAHE
jgi:hypothetical protein